MKVDVQPHRISIICEYLFHAGSLDTTGWHYNDCVVRVLDDWELIVTTRGNRQVQIVVMHGVINRCLKQIRSKYKEQGGQWVPLTDTTFAPKVFAGDPIK